MHATVGSVLIALAFPAALFAQFVQQGPKLVGSGAVFDSMQGRGVAISADGNTAAVGGSGDDFFSGAVWVYTRSGGVWTQQGPKLVGSGATPGQIGQGGAVALSADGNTLIEGGLGDNNGLGAAWVFVRSGGVWSQQGSKLVGTGAIGGPVFEGSSVALSADGNTAIVGGQNDNGGAGAAWVFTRSVNVWTQQGAKLVGSGAALPAGQAGRSLSGDGNIALIGGPGDANPGAAWVFTRSGGVWSQQGSKLVGTGFSGTHVVQGASAALSADGTTAIVGGPGDHPSASDVGAAWIFVAAPSADLAIVKTVSPAGPFAPHQPATYTITVTNNGPGSSSGVTVTDALPGQVTFASATPTQGSCSGTTTVTCSLGTLAAGASASVAIAITIGATLGPVSNTATVTASTTDPNPANDSSTAAFNVVAQIPAMSLLGLFLLAAALAIAAAAALR